MMAYPRVPEAGQILADWRREHGRWPTVKEAGAILRDRTGSRGGTDRLRRLIHEGRAVELEAKAEAAAAIGDTEAACGARSLVEAFRKSATKARTKHAERVRTAAAARGLVRIVVEIPPRHRQLVRAIAGDLSLAEIDAAAVLRRHADQLGRGVPGGRLPENT